MQHNHFSQRDMLFSRHASEVRGIYKAAVYSVCTKKATPTGRKQGYIYKYMYKVYIWQGESTWEHRVPIYGRTVTGRRDTLTGREGSPSQAASQWEQEREEDSVNRGREGWGRDAVMGACRFDSCIGWFSSQQVQHSETQSQIKYPPSACWGS